MRFNRKCVYIILAGIIVMVIACIIDYSLTIPKAEDIAVPNNVSNKETVDEEDDNDYSSEEEVNEDDKLVTDSNIWLYAADYQTSGLPLYYTTYGKYTHYLQDIVLPYININSEDARRANEEIEELYNLLISRYREGIDDELTFIDICDYEYTHYDNVGSVLITYGIGFTSIVHPVYVAYNFDLDTGELLSFEEIYEKVGITSEEINVKVKQAIENYLISKFATWENFEYDNQYVEVSYSNYLEAVENNELVYYLTASDEMQIVVDLFIPADTDSFDTLLTIYG